MQTREDSIVNPTDSDTAVSYASERISLYAVRKIFGGCVQRTALNFCSRLGVPVKEDEATGRQYVGAEYEARLKEASDKKRQYDTEYFSIRAAAIVLGIDKQVVGRISKRLGISEPFDLVGNTYVKKSDLSQIKEQHLKFLEYQNTWTRINELRRKWKVDQRKLLKLCDENNLLVESCYINDYRYVHPEHVEKLEDAIREYKGEIKSSSALPLYDSPHEIHHVPVPIRILPQKLDSKGLEQRVKPGKIDRKSSQKPTGIDSLLHHDYLTADDEVRLGKELEMCYAKGEVNKEAVDEFVLKNIKLVASVVRKYKGRGLSDDDLMQEGILGLMKAVYKWDYKRGTRFSSHALWWIRQGITLALIYQSSTIRLPANVRQNLKNIRRTRAHLRAQSGKDPSVFDVADYCSLEPANVKMYLCMDMTPASIHAKLDYRDDAELGDLIEGDSVDFDIGVRQFQVRKVLSRLPERESYVLKLRYGLGCEPMTLEQVGKQIGLTKERIRQIEEKALQRLRDTKHADKLKDFYLSG